MEKLYIFGDSIARGVIFDELKNRYAFTKNTFANLFAEKTGTIAKTNARFGCTVTKGVELLQKAELDGYENVAFEFGGNDCNFDWEAISLAPEGEHLPATPLQTFYDTYTGMISRCLEKGKRVFLFNLPPIDDEKYFRWISKDRSAENILKWLGGSTRFIYTWHESYNCAVANLANRMNVTLVDIRSVFLQLRNYRDYLCADGIHPNEKGHALISEVLQAVLV